MRLIRKWTKNLFRADNAGSSVESPMPTVQIEDKDDEEDSQIKPTCRDYLLFHRTAHVVYVLTACAILGILLPVLISQFLVDYEADLRNCQITQYKFECLSGSSEPVTQNSCERAGCCWNNKSSPACFNTNPTRYRYQVVSVPPVESNRIRVDLKAERPSDPLNNTLVAAKFIVRALNPHHLVVQLLKRDDSEESFRAIGQDMKTPLDETDFQVNVATKLKKSFGVMIKRKNSNQVIFDTTRGPLSITDEYVEMTTILPSTHLYGIGQDWRSTFKRNFNYNKIQLYNRNQADSFLPFFMVFDDGIGTGNVYGVFWDNWNPLEMQLSPTPALSFRSTGGGAIIHILSGPTPSDVSKQYAEEIAGKVQMPPFWSLGFHLCRESDDDGVFDETLQLMQQSNISFDSDCIDLRLSGPGSGAIDYTTFPRAKEQIDKLRKADKKFLLAQPPHVPALSQESSYEPISKGHNDSSALVGARFKSSVVYPSFPDLGDNVTDIIDMNEMQNPDGVYFVDNFPTNDLWSEAKCADRRRSFVPDKLKLTANTLCSDALHHNNKEHISVHNVYGVQQMRAFIEPQLQQQHKRLLYLNKASALGNLGLAGYFNNDLYSNWDSMKSSLIQVLEMGLFGIPLSGTAICGSKNYTSGYIDEEQLCMRWYQMALFLPLAQSFTALNQRMRGPTDWSDNFARSIGTLIQIRYKLLPYFYTLFYTASVEGTPVVRPLYYEFPKDNLTYSIDEQFMIGKCILVCPIMNQDSSMNGATMKVYFPSGNWYDYYTGQLIIASTGVNKQIPTTLPYINMFIRGGTIFVTQEAGKTAEDTRRTKYTATVSFSSKVEMIRDQLYIDDGLSASTDFDLIQFQCDGKSFLMRTINNTLDKRDSISTIVDTVVILGITQFNPFNLNRTLPEEALFEYNANSATLYIKNLNYDWKIQEQFSFSFN